jgi:predicted DNA-binding antitoxin AbrB/MazE fold protein
MNQSPQKGEVHMSGNSLSVEAVFENGVLRPMQPLPLRPQQRVTITLQLPSPAVWPDDVAAIYQELAAEDRRLAEAMLPVIRETWPVSEEQP